MPIHLDHNATSPMHAPIIDAVPPFRQNPLRRPREVPISGGGENPAGIVAPGKAAQLARLEMEQRRLHLGQSRDRFESRSGQLPGSVVFGRQAARGDTSCGGYMRVE